jgi:HlyD family secretion protein
MCNHSGWRPQVNRVLPWGRFGVAVILALAVVSCSESNASESAGGSDEVARVERGDLDIRVEAAGQIEPIMVIEVKSKASGEITALHVDTGDEVERGHPLANIDPRDVRNALSQAEADLEVARARLQISQSQYQRSQELRQANVVTQQEYEQNILDVANARAQLVKAQTNLELARERMGDVAIRAPIAGTVIQKSVEAGQIIASASGNVSGGTTLLLMADLREMQVRTLVDETDIGKVQPGQPARVRVEAYPTRSFAGTVLKIEPRAVIEQNVTMFPVLVRLDNRDGLLKPNMNAEVQIDVAQRSDVVLVPNAAVVSMQDATAAGQVLGLSPEATREGLRSSRFVASPAAAGPRGGGEDASADAGAAAGADAPSSPARAGEAAGAVEDCQALLERARGGERGTLSEAERAQLRACAQQLGLSGGGRGGGGGGWGGEPGSGDTRPAVVFVNGPKGPEPRSVVLGLNDWDRSEVVSGLEAGEEVILISVARLRQQQEELLARIRERSSGPIPGASGGPMGGGRGGR